MASMQFLFRGIALAALCASFHAAAQPAAAAPDFALGYRAWNLVTEFARHNRNPALSGECGSTFRAVAVPALRRQTKQEQDAASAVCYQRARELCANPALARTPDIATKCGDFR